jgi:hypothetical protein
VSNEEFEREEQLQSLAGTCKLASSSKRRAILILGMHRSGTSALAGAISALGVAEPKTLLGTNNWNPRGYFESAPLRVAHDELLASACSRWDDWRQFNPRWFRSKAAEQHRQKIKALLLEEFGDESLIFVKDPRMCRFVPFIVSILTKLEFSPVAILLVRNPLEVAHSLKRRDGLALSKSILLWLRHVLDAEFHSRHMPRCFLSYEEFLNDWRYYVDRVAEKTGIIWPDRSDRSDVEIDQFLTLDLRHERVPFDETRGHPEVSPLVRETYDILTNIAAGGENKELLDQLDQARAKFDEGCHTFGAAMASEAAAHNSLIAERDTLSAAHNSLVSEHDALARDYNNLTAERDALTGAYNALVSRHEALARDYNNLTAERDALTGAYNALTAARDAMLSSHSWRLTAPMRYLRRLFSR